MATVQAKYEHRIRSAVSQRVPLSVLASPIAPAKFQQMCNNPKIVGVGRRLSESLGQGLVMAPPRARMTNDRSTGVAINVKLAGIGTSRRLLRYRPLAAADYADCAVK